ncbi:MAG: glycosyltransferase family 4 protein [Alphaproteobacteria bacterium]|nr:glycosyltransferase family 4 protein [Alphaproteobacteria bacterium]
MTVRLLMVLNDAPFFVSHRLPIARAAKAAGIEVHIAVRHDEEAVAVMRREGFTHHDLPLERGSRRLGGELALIATLWRLMRDLKPDVVHAVTMKPVIYGGFVARLLGVPAVVHAITGLGYLFLIEGLGARLQRFLVKTLYRFALGHGNSRAIFQNPDDLGLFRASHLVDDRRVRMIKGCGIDMTRYQPLPEPPGPVVVTFPARILGDKGVHEFVGAARQLRAEGVAARFVLVGRTDPDNPTDVGETGIRAWEREGIVQWQGYSRDMVETFRQCHIVCMPSYREGLPRVLIEAAACGRAIVTADVPGCREVVREGENGFLVPVRDTEATAVALRRLILDETLRQRMAARGRAMVEHEFSEPEFVARSFAVYREVCPAFPAATGTHP